MVSDLPDQPKAAFVKRSFRSGRLALLQRYFSAASALLGL
jgi:hypothetical protein